MKFVTTLVIQKRDADLNNEIVRVYFANGWYGTPFFPGLFFPTLESLEKQLQIDYDIL
ncbi:MAG: hypothetical protein II937_09680 [Bacteroidales bacterium]|nr:hypothetical protein [Bacteroidales bacterium]